MTLNYPKEFVWPTRGGERLRDSMPRVFDFTRSRWGHALHASTFSQIRRKNPLDSLVDRFKGVHRFSVMVHCSPTPINGDTVIWKGNRGVVQATIYDVDWCRDPDDMYTLFVTDLKAATPAQISA